MKTYVWLHEQTVVLDQCFDNVQKGGKRCCCTTETSSDALADPFDEIDNERTETGIRTQTGECGETMPVCLGCRCLRRNQGGSQASKVELKFLR